MIDLPTLPLNNSSREVRSSQNLEHHDAVLHGADKILDAKLHLVDNALDEIGFTSYHLKLFVLNGFGYAAESLINLIQSTTAKQAALEFQPKYPNSLTVALYVGMLTGALFWGTSADMIGRRFAFNASLLISSIFAIIAGAAPNWIALALFVSLSAFGSGGNLALDTAIYLEYLPSKYRWSLTTMASWWGIGQMITGLFAWAFLPNFSCSDIEICTKDNNMGWRYAWFANGGVVFVLSILRLSIIRLKETPKFLVNQSRDEQAVETLHFIAGTYNRRCSLTLEMMRTCETNRPPFESHREHKTSRFKEIGFHIWGLFHKRREGLSTSLIWLSWTTIGLAYPLYNVFLPQYLQSRGANFGHKSQHELWRNYTVSKMSSIFSPILAGYLCTIPTLGRKGTMVIGALSTMAFLFAYTSVRNEASNIGFTCAINFCLNIYYGTLYAYTPEVLPSTHRGTGNGIAIGCNRFMGIICAIIATETNTDSAVPIYICAALYVTLAILSVILPFEPLNEAR